MSSVSNVTSSTGSTASTTSSSTPISNDEFLTLLVTQLENQDPLDPTDTAEFMTEMCQLTSVEAIYNMSDVMNSMSDVLTDMSSTLDSIYESIGTADQS